MNAAYIHLALNHVPVLGVIFALGLLVIGVLRRNQTLLHAAWVTLVVVALAALPVFFSGKDAEDIVKREPGVSRDAIEAHEEIALVALIGMEALGLLALTGVVLSRRGGSPPWLRIGSLVLALVVAGLMTVTAQRGGRINHPEAHGDAAPAEEQGGRGRH
jgi:uncharacterized membrane protein